MATLFGVERTEVVGGGWLNRWMSPSIHCLFSQLLILLTPPPTFYYDCNCKSAGNFRTKRVLEIILFDFFLTIPEIREKSHNVSDSTSKEHYPSHFSLPSRQHCHHVFYLHHCHQPITYQPSGRISLFEYDIKNAICRERYSRCNK